jgi:hypothetical protein
MTEIKVGDFVTWRSAGNPNALGITGCKVVELGEAEDGRKAARLDMGQFGEACAAVDDLVPEDKQ